MVLAVEKTSDSSQYAERGLRLGRNSRRERLIHRNIQQYS